MKSRVLYFPYIRVPKSSWLTQMLLYWDQVSSIVPFDFIQKPELLGPYMQSLVREGLVFQVIPGAQIHRLPRFFDAFSGYIGGLGQEIDRRRKNFTRGDASLIHIEKLGKIEHLLVRERLAARGQYPWFDVERETADDFMSYLAVSLGQLEAIDSTPVTDDRGYLSRFSRAGVPNADVTTQLELLRVQVLDQVLPVPSHSVEPSRIRAFKERFQSELGDFRRRVERELIEAASISHPTLRERRLEIFFEEAEAGVQQIQEAMRGAGWKTGRTSLSVLAAIPGVTPLLGLAGALWDAVSGGSPRQMPREFAYAAHARSQLAKAV